MTTIWRLHIKPDPKEGVDPRMFCIERNLPYRAELIAFGLRRRPSGYSI